MTSTDAGITIRESELQYLKPEKDCRRQSAANTPSSSDVHSLNASSPITSSDAGIWIRESDMHCLNP
jgi:hypothetical protein